MSDLEADVKQLTEQLEDWIFSPDKEIMETRLLLAQDMLEMLRS